MSQASSDSDEIIAMFQTDLVATFAVCSTVALVAYEYILTANQEVTMIWRRKWTLVTWLFMSNRYLMIATTIISVSPFTAQVGFVHCGPAMVLSDIFLMVQYLVFAAFSALRVFAIWDRNLPMTLVALILNLAPVVITAYLYTQARVVFTVDPVLGTYCGYISIIPASVVLKYWIVSIGTRLPVIVADILVLALTWRKTFRHRREAIRVGVQTPLSALLLRDGTVYFLALLVMNIAQVLVDTVPSLQISSPVTIIFLVLNPILISRFLLNLRQLDEPKNETQSRFNSQFSIPGFRVPTSTSIVGNMGAELDHGPAEEADNDSEDAGVESRNEASVDGAAENLPGAPFTADVLEVLEVPRDAI